MNKEKQRILIAEACVKTMSCCRCQEKAQVFKYGAPFCSDECAEACGDFALDCGQQSIPDYLNDLNAMHEAEKTLKYKQLEQMHFILAEITAKQIPPKRHTAHDFMWHVPAVQRAEAFLKTIGKWEDE